MGNSGSELRLWDRNGTDTDRSYEAFEVYRLMGTGRSLAKVAERLRKSDTIIERWSRRDGWGERVKAWDRYEAREVNIRVLTGTAEMRLRMVNQALGMQARAQSRILKMSDDEIAQLRPSEIVALMRLASDMERKARDIPEAQFMMVDQVPTFEIQVIRPADNMVGVQLEDGRCGYIPDTQIPRFRHDFPTAVVLA